MTVHSLGTLQIGSGGATGSFAHDITDNGIVAFDRGLASVLTYSNVISGTGEVGQIGMGRTILTGVNTYLGGTFINAGTLQVSADDNLGAAPGPLSFNGGTLNTTATFGSSRAATLAPTAAHSTSIPARL